MDAHFFDDPEYYTPDEQVESIADIIDQEPIRSTSVKIRIYETYSAIEKEML